MENVIGFFSLGFLVVINIILVAYSYGKMTQGLGDLCRRVENLEKRVFTK